VLYNEPTENADKWSGPYLDKDIPPDPWGRPYQYSSPGRNGPYDLFSFGKDGRAGGTGDAVDITN